MSRAKEEARNKKQEAREKSLLIFSCLLLASCLLHLPLHAGPAVSSPPAAPDAAAKMESGYLLQPGDRVSIRIYPEDEYIKGGEMEISSEGNITLPLVGKIAVAGKTIIEAERTIRDLLAEDYLVSPEVVIEVLQYKQHSVVVLGQVRKPGTYPFPQGTTQLTLLQAISLAGGFSDVANTKKIQVMRNKEGAKQTIQANAEAIINGKEHDIEVMPGDIVNVSESLF